MQSVPDENVEVGDSWSWIPSAFTEFSGAAGTLLGAAGELHGVVIQVNREHRWFRVEARCPGGTIRETFKF